MSDTRLLAALRYATFIAAAHYEAYRFIATVHEGKHNFQSSENIAAEIALVAALSPINTGGDYPTSSHVYRRAYSEKLHLLQHELLNPTPELYRLRYDAEGYHNALDMAFRNHGNVDTVLRALEGSEHTRSMQEESQPESAVQRRYAQGYRQGLQDAIALIEAQETPLVAYAPDWFESDALPQLNQLLSVRQQYDAAQAAYTILQQSEGDIWRVDRSIIYHQQWLERVQHSGDQTMETYVRDLLAWLQQGREIIAVCGDFS